MVVLRPRWRQPEPAPEPEAETEADASVETDAIDEVAADDEAAGDEPIPDVGSVLALVKITEAGETLKTACTEPGSSSRTEMLAAQRMLRELRAGGSSDAKTTIDPTGPSGRSQRRGRDSNPRYRGYPHNGFRDRPIQPLWHPSEGSSAS